MGADEFDTSFATLTGNSPFPWQMALFREFTSGTCPSSCNLPTGLGKTSVIPIWLLALATSAPGSIPRRLVYVVNRRTVVDQATEAAEVIRKRLREAPELSWLRDRLKGMCAATDGMPLSISTLRGQFADNREWSADPARPAVIVGTVDMIGSRLLFEGYGCGFKTRPLHAGFLGQDVLLVHDEAHLEPAFQRLLEAIRDEQHDRERTGLLPWPKLRVMALTATPRAGGETFGLTEADHGDARVQRRVRAKKAIELHEIDDEKKGLVPKIVELALVHRRADPQDGPAVLIFVRTLAAIEEVKKGLRAKGIPEANISSLTGNSRGLERGRQATPQDPEADPVFARFLKPPRETDAPWKVVPQPGTVFLVCTSAGEVGVDMSADHMVCDLTPFDGMAQRFGRVNRYGDRTDTRIDVVHPKSDGFGEDDFDVRRCRTLNLLWWLFGDASPAALGELPADARVAAFTPPPDILPVDDILFDAWALTTIRGHLPARPPVEDWLHGVSDRDPPETHVAWREEVELLSPAFKGEKGNPREARDQWEAACERREPALAELLGEFPLKPHELLRDRTARVHESLAVLAQGRETTPAWVIEPDDTVRITTLGDLTEKDKKGFVVPLGGRTVVLPPAAGGLTAAGTLDGSAAFVVRPREEYDVAGHVPVRGPADGSERNSGLAFLRLVRSVRSDGSVTFRVVGCPFDLARRSVYDPAQDERPEREFLDATFEAAGLPRMKPAYETSLYDEGDESHVEGQTAADEEDENGEGDEAGRAVTFVVFKRVGERRQPRGNPAWPALDRHQAGVRYAAQAICDRIALPPELAKAVAFAAGCHDSGKDRGVWQRGAGNRPDRSPVAKTLHGRPPENLNGFRHEFASLIDARSCPEVLAEFETFAPEMQDVILHLIAAHHGRGRPHFPGRGDADLRPRRSTKNTRRRMPQAENFDPERPNVAATCVAGEIPSRFARLQWKYGRWGLAYLESLVRAADALDSRRIEETPVGDREPGTWPRPAPAFSWSPGGKGPAAAIRVRVEPTNPGQFFACCGLLELAHRLWTGAEGWFDGPEFCLRPAEPGGHARATARGLIDELARCRVTNVMTPEQLTLLDQLSRMKGKDRSESQEATKKELESIRRESPVRFHSPDKLDLRIDWFLDERAGGSRFKTWAGQQSVIDIAQGMHGPLLKAKWSDIPPAEWLSRSGPVDALPFYFDSGLSGQGSALDAGFSFDPLGFKMPSRPLLELAAFIGLQRFRPLQVPGENLYRFDLWPTPLLPSVAAAAACGAAAVAGARRYEFRLLYRTKYLKSFLPAQPYRGDAQ